MKLESQVCSLDLAKRLKELGVKQESCFFWSKYNAIEDWELKGCIDTHALENISAFTVAELGEMLPYQIAVGENDSRGQITTWKLQSGIWGCSYLNYIGKLPLIDIFHGDTEAAARAKMLIYLIEQGLVKL